VDFAEDGNLTANVKAHRLDSRLQATMPLTDIYPGTPEMRKVHFIVKPGELHS